MLLDIRCEDVRYLYCPAFEGLTKTTVLKKAAEFPSVEDYLPDLRDRLALNRQIFVNLIYSISQDILPARTTRSPRSPEKVDWISASRERMMSMTVIMRRRRRSAMTSQMTAQAQNKTIRVVQ